jgi:hypothetical protein
MREIVDCALGCVGMPGIPLAIYDPLAQFVANTLNIISLNIFNAFFF